MAHLRAQIFSKDGKVSRLGNKRDGMVVLIEGANWSVKTIVTHDASKGVDHVFVANVDRTARTIGEVVRLEFPTRIDDGGSES